MEDLQFSQATIWAKVQSLYQRTSTPQTPQRGHLPQGEIERLSLVPSLNQEQGAPHQPARPQASPYLTGEDIASILLEARKGESSIYIDTRHPLILPTTHLLSYPNMRAWLEMLESISGGM